MLDTVLVGKQVVNVKLTYLLGLYAIIPLALLLVWFDQSTLNRAILHSSPFRPESWIVWFYVFGMPHVVGGIQMFADKEYLQHYGWRLLRVFVVCLVVPPLVVSLLGQQYLFVIFMLFIVHHTVAQQFGLTLVALKRPPDVAFHVWKWTAVGVGVVLYSMLYFVPFPLVVFNAYGMREPLLLVGEILLGLFLASAVALVWKHRGNRLGVAHVICNVALIATDCYLFYVHYFFLVVLIGRVIHEFTAWPIYVVHDRNRNLVSYPNWLFRGFRWVASPAVLSLVFAFSLGFALTYAVTLVSAMSSVIVSLSIYHYYTEHFLWRRDGLLRKHVNLIA